MSYLALAMAACSPTVNKHESSESRCPELQILDPLEVVGDHAYERIASNCSYFLLDFYTKSRLGRIRSTSNTLEFTVNNQNADEVMKKMETIAQFIAKNEGRLVGPDSQPRDRALTILQNQFSDVTFTNYRYSS